MAIADPDPIEKKRSPIAHASWKLLSSQGKFQDEIVKITVNSTIKWLLRLLSEILVCQVSNSILIFFHYRSCINAFESPNPLIIWPYLWNENGHSMIMGKCPWTRPRVFSSAYLHCKKGLGIPLLFFIPRLKWVISLCTLVWFFSNFTFYSDFLPLLFVWDKK